MLCRSRLRPSSARGVVSAAIVLILSQGTSLALAQSAPVCPAALWHRPREARVQADARNLTEPKLNIDAGAIAQFKCIRLVEARSSSHTLSLKRLTLWFSTRSNAPVSQNVPIWNVSETPMSASSLKIRWLPNTSNTMMTRNTVTRASGRGRVRGQTNTTGCAQNVSLQKPCDPSTAHGVGLQHINGAGIEHSAG